MRRWILALGLLVSLAPAAFAGGLYANIEGPDRDGVTYTARTYSCDPNVSLEPWAYAEGVVDGKRQSYLIRLKPTDEHGVYTFQRTWPKGGIWMIRYSLGHPPAPATVATLAANGKVVDNHLYWKSDGSQECHKALKKVAKFRDDDC